MYHTPTGIYTKKEVSLFLTDARKYKYAFGIPYKMMLRDLQLQNVDAFCDIHRGICALSFRATAKNGSSRSVLGHKRVGRSTKAASTQFGLT